jgi:uncharacterized protein (DUF427 family)
MWQNTGKARPPFAEEPGPEQESVWDYPRPPALVSCVSLVEVGSSACPLACTSLSLRVIETASPPSYYLPADSVDWKQLVRAGGSSFCEWKGAATYWALVEDPSGELIGWSYEQPNVAFAALDGCLSFYLGRIACYVDGERVQPQAGSFYGGWVTSKISGPFKGAPRTAHW